VKLYPSSFALTGSQNHSAAWLSIMPVSLQYSDPIT
jgi:hypothetical protein